MAKENKTQPTRARVDDYLAAISDDARRADCIAVAAMMARVTGEPATMWGSGIVGFGSYHYCYDSGREGDACLTGFASRANDISVYLTAGFPEQETLLATLGRHRMGKACLYIRRLADVDLAVLERLIAGSVAAMRDRYG
jgi:hypothetical protein